MYIPASVTEINENPFRGTKCTIHCAENSAAHRLAVEEELPVVLDPSLDVSEVTDTSGTTAVAFCSYATDKKDEAEKIIGQLAKKNCSVVSAGALDGNEKLERLDDARCVVAFLSKGYINTKEISWLRMAISAGKPYLIYALDDSPLSVDIAITKGSEQQLRYDKNGQKELAALIEWLSKNGCRKASGDMPDYEYTRNPDGDTILTKFTGNGGDVLIPREYAGCRIGYIGNSAFCGCRSLISVTIPDSVTSIGYRAFVGCKKLIVYCPENSEAWKYCKKEHVKHKPLSQYNPNKKSHVGLAAAAMLLALIAAAGVQFSWLFDILGWLTGLFG